MTSQPHDERRPNVIWIFGDQHRAQAQSHMGDPNLSTPEMDRLATEGVAFKRAAANNPWCTPFRGSLLTGKHAHDTCHRVGSRLDPSLPVITDVFNDAGYHTAYFGKWHLDGHDPGGHPPSTLIVPRERRGRFQTWVGYENNNSQHDCHVHGHVGDEEVGLERLPGYETDSLTDMLIDYVGERGKQAAAARERDASPQPFFAVLSVQPPHNPYVAPAGAMARHRPATVELRPNVPPIDRVQEEARRNLAGYYAMIENLDANLGRVREKLDATGLKNDTIIMFFSDHGDMHGCHGYRLKSSPWEESIRIPFTIGGMRPYVDMRSRRTDAPMSTVDIAPTTLGLCGLEAPDWMVGFDYTGYVRGRGETPLEGEPDHIYLQHVVRKHHSTCIDREWRGIVTRDGWKYVCSPESPYLLINLNEDPYELYNMALDPYAIEHRKRMHARLKDAIAAAGDQFVLPEV